MRLSGLLFLVLCSTPFEVHADKKQQLQEVEKKIEQLQQKMRNTRSQQDQLQQDLAQAEQQIGQLADKLETFADDLTLKQQSLAEFRQQHQLQATKLQQQQEILAQQIRSSYIIGRRDYLKILLNQEDPSTVGRMLQYYDYFNQARSLRISTINEAMNQIQMLENKIEQQSQQIQQLLIEQTDKKQQLEQQNQKRQQILGQLSGSLVQQSHQLKQLLDDRQHLQILLGIVATNTPDFIEKSLTLTPFSQLKGQLSWPVQGKIAQSFGKRKSVGNLKWQGWLIDAAAGQKVRTIAAGKVEFSGWFRHLGQLLIIKHDQNYMSLYAHNRSLYPKQGDWVKAGDIIASVGNSGGQAQTGLYFELRYQGQAIDPAIWLNP